MVPQKRTNIGEKKHIDEEVTTGSWFWSRVNAAHEKNNWQLSRRNQRLDSWRDDSVLVYLPVPKAAPATTTHTCRACLIYK